MKCSAVFSRDRVWRYELRRTWDETQPSVMFVGLNPSTADEAEDDPTVRRCIRFASGWGFGELIMTNIFAYRATDPREMKKATDPVGPWNDDALQACADEATLVVAAWGAHGAHRDRDQVVRELLGHFAVLGLTKGGQPRHPLYLPAGVRPLDSQTLNPINGSVAQKDGSTS